MTGKFSPESPFCMALFERKDIKSRYKYILNVLNFEFKKMVLSWCNNFMSFFLKKIKFHFIGHKKNSSNKSQASKKLRKRKS